jgi:Family of unknown function (DUF5677)
VESLGLGDFDYSSQVVDEQSLLSATDEEPFSRESFEVLKELAQSVVLTAGVQRLNSQGQPRPLTRDEAILGGLMARCAKLHDGLLQSCTPQRMEHLNFFLRGVTETAVTLRYLLENGGPELFESFVRYSLRVDKQLFDQIKGNITDRGGVVLPIEDRLLEGIEKAFRVAGVDMGSIDAADRSSGWPNIYRRFEALGLKDSYVSMFGVQSHYVHGNWHDLYAHHLAVDAEGGFQVEVRFGAIRPQPLLAAIVVLTDASLRYLCVAADPSDDRAVLEDRLAFCGEKARTIEALHERFLEREPSGPGA